jgi:hypothetical protein
MLNPSSEGSMVPGKQSRTIIIMVQVIGIKLLAIMFLIKAINFTA